MIFCTTLWLIMILKQLIIIVVSMVFLIGMGTYSLKHEAKKSDLKKIQSLGYSDFILPIAVIIYAAIAIIFAAIEMEFIAGWMGSLGFITLGICTLYFSKQRISEGKIYSIFGYYDKKKNYKGFIIVIAIYFFGGILEIGLGIFVLTALL